MEWFSVVLQLDSLHTCPARTEVIINNEVYDVTKFLELHPGGPNVIMHYAGMDATDEFKMLHRPTILYEKGRMFKIGKLSANSGECTRPISADELSRHSTRTDCWTSIHGKVYDVTSFLDDHPGGAKIMLKYAGRDSTAAFDAAAHPMDIVDQLGLQHLQVGLADRSIQAEAPSSKMVHEATQTTAKPHIDTMLSLFDIEAVARMELMSRNPQGWAYYSSGADDEITMRENRLAYQRIWFRPRALVNVKSIDLRTRIMGFPSSCPIYITACALGKLAHPEGEVLLTRGAQTHGIIQMCPTLASCTLEEMTAAAQPGQIQFFQLYVNHNKEVTKKLIARAKEGGIKAICVTVDAPQLGRREKDMRNKFTLQAADVQKEDAGEDSDKGSSTETNANTRGGGAARTISAFIDPSLNWDDISWIKEACYPMKVLLKGVQCAEDALKAVEYGLDGIICSNHGGRQMDFARSGVEVLEEVMHALDEHRLRDRLEVLVDGGIRRGADVIKAVALGATGVGVGRPALYGMASYGQQGVEKMIQILKDEMIMGMRLVGAPTIKHIKRSMVVTKTLSTHVTAVPQDNLNNYVYEPLKTTSKL